MSKILIVGDVHATPQELDDCVALSALIHKTAAEEKCDLVIYLGDQHNTHDVVNTRVIDFWKDHFQYLLDKGISVLALVGNHDQLTPTIRSPHAMVSYKDQGSTSAMIAVVDKVTCGFVASNAPESTKLINYLAVPYYADPEEFVTVVTEAKKLHPEVDVLFCHQTFVGAEQGLGFYSKDSVDPNDIPFKLIISGHIHKPMKIGKVWYPGAPRWRTLTDAEVEKRAIWLWEPGSSPKPIFTNEVCTRIFKLEDSEGNPVDDKVAKLNLKTSDLRITVSGTSDYISKRIPELRVKYGARCQGLPIKGRLIRISESEGVDKAFYKFGEGFVPPNGTDKDFLLKEANGRLRATIGA